MPDNNKNSYERYFESRIVQIFIAALAFLLMTISSAYINQWISSNAVREKQIDQITANVEKISDTQVRLVSQVANRLTISVADEKFGRVNDHIDNVSTTADRNRNMIEQYILSSKNVSFYDQFPNPAKPKNDINQRYAINKRSGEKLERVEITDFGS